MAILTQWDGLKARGITLSRATIYRHMAAGEFPQSVKQGQWKISWVADEIDQWIVDRANARGEARQAS
jgi:prophage regulatory protein